MQDCAIRIDTDEALRYLGVRGEAEPRLSEKMNELADKLLKSLQPKFVYRIFDLSTCDVGIVLVNSGLCLPGKLAARMLEGYQSAAVLLCTLGSGFESMLRALQARDMSEAVMLDALGSAYVEAGCDAAEEEIRGRLTGLYLTDRFSPGYGDLPLELQKDICGLLDAGRRLGVTITESLLMNPSKSVTAVIGISDRPQPARIRGCEYCSRKTNCEFRKGGQSCVS